MYRTNRQNNKLYFILIGLFLVSCNDGIEKNLNLARKAEDNKNFQSAIKYLDKVLKINPNHLIALNNRGWNRIDTGDTIGALSDFNAMILSDTTCERGYYNRGTVFLYQKKYSEALLDFNKALKIKGIIEMDSSYNIPPLFKLEFTNNQYFGTHANENSQKPETNTEWLFFRKGSTNYELKNYQSAHKDFCYCIYTHKDFLAEAYYLRAFVYYDTGNREQACKDLQQAALNGYDVPNDEYEIICNNSKSGSKYDK